MIGAGLSTFSGTHASALSEEETKYDVNGDGVVDAKDAEYIAIFYVTAIAEMPSSKRAAFNAPMRERSEALKKATIDRIGEKEYYKYDIDGDGFANAKDATHLYQYLGETTGKTDDELEASISDKTYITEEYLKAIGEPFGLKLKLMYADDKCTDIGTVDDKTGEEEKIESLKGFKPGDANGDGVTDAKDATLVLTSYAQQISDSINKASYESQISYQLNADVNGDGVIDAKDATCMLVTYAKNIYNGIV